MSPRLTPLYEIQPRIGDETLALRRVMGNSLTDANIAARLALTRDERLTDVLIFCTPPQRGQEAREHVGYMRRLSDGTPGIEVDHNDAPHRTKAVTWRAIIQHPNSTEFTVAWGATVEAASRRAERAFQEHILVAKEA